MICFQEPLNYGKGTGNSLMSKLAEWLIAILAAVILGYLLVDHIGLPVWLAGAVGIGLIGLGLVIGSKKKP